MSLYRRWPLSEITGFVRRQAVGVGAQARAAERAYQQVGAKNSYLAATPCSLVDEDRSAPLLSAFNDAMLTHHSVARPIAERALQLDPGCPSAVAPLAYMLIASGCRHHRVKAGELLSHCAARSRKRARPWTRREQHLHHGLLLAADLRPGAAVEAFSASLAQDPFDPLLVRMVCDLAYWRGDMERGWEVVHAATESAQSRADALTEHSRALLLGYSAFFTDQCGDGAAALALAEESESATAASYSQPAVAAPRSWGNPWALHAKIHALEGMEDAEGVLAALGAFAVDHGGHSSFLRTHMAFHAGMAVLHASAPAPAASEQAAVLGVFDAAWASANREYGHDLGERAVTGPSLHCPQLTLDVLFPHPHRSQLRGAPVARREGGRRQHRRRRPLARARPGRARHRRRLRAALHRLPRCSGPSLRRRRLRRRWGSGRPQRSGRDTRAAAGGAQPRPQGACGPRGDRGKGEGPSRVRTTAHRRAAGVGR